MVILSRESIRDRIGRPLKDPKRLTVTPLLDEAQIGPGSIDIRLGFRILLYKKTRVSTVDVTDIPRISQMEVQHYAEVDVPFHSKFVLHPNELILAGTFEYICLPYDLFAVVVSRSSWGRLGLLVATASVVHPRFKGCLTLELCNMSETPITLHPGLAVGQLVIYEVDASEESESYEGRYLCPTGPERPRFTVDGKPKDPELEFWGGKPDMAK
jgi:dCTP deaminase